MYAVICVLNVYYICVLHSNCSCAVGYALLGICHLRTPERTTTFEQMQGIHQAREAFTKSLNILLFYPNCDQQILDSEIFLLTLQYSGGGAGSADGTMLPNLTINNYEEILEENICNFILQYGKFSDP